MIDHFVPLFESFQHLPWLDLLSPKDTSVSPTCLLLFLLSSSSIASLDYSLFTPQPAFFWMCWQQSNHCVSYLSDCEPKEGPVCYFNLCAGSSRSNVAWILIVVRCFRRQLCMKSRIINSNNNNYLHHWGLALGRSDHESPSNFPYLMLSL